MPSRLKRRVFLRGLGGACVAAPFLGSITERVGTAQAAPVPKRLVLFFTHYGCLTTRWFPTKSHGALAAADLEATTLKPLTPFIPKMLLPRGIRAMNEWNQNVTRGQGNDTFLQIAAAHYTCQPVTPNSDDPFSFDTSTKFNAKAMGPSLDHVITQSLSPGGTPLVLRVGGYNDSPQSAVSYSAAQTIYPGQRLSDAYSALTGLFSDGPLTPDSYQVLRGKSVLDAVAEDLATLERFDLSQADRDKLEAWKALLHDTNQAMASAQCTSELATALGVTSGSVAAAGNVPLGSDALMNQVTDSLDGADLHSNLTVLALLCGTNPVVLLKYPGSYVFRGLGIPIESTSLSHRMDNASLSGPCFPNAIDDIAAIDNYYVQKFAHLVGLLDSFPEGDGTVLDNSAAVWAHEVSDGAARNLNNLPILQIGSLGGYFKTGWTVNVEDGAPNLSKGNSEGACTADTGDMINALTQSTGTDPKLANAPINKYYCNLLNAMGVKAGADGFAAQGGTAPVIRFGMYDKTEDFIGGGTKPPTIHDPGEFTALRA